jgi:3-deoxy-7-phosphoheptulonate synthase
MAQASVAAGADLLLVEVHPNPKEATSDGAQTLDFNQFAAMMDSITKIASAIDRNVQTWEMNS